MIKDRDLMDRMMFEADYANVLLNSIRQEVGAGRTFASKMYLLEKIDKLKRCLDFLEGCCDE